MSLEKKMELEDNHKLLIEILSSMNTMKVRLDSLSDSNKDLTARFEGLEKELSDRLIHMEGVYNKVVGGIQLTAFVGAALVGILTLTANLWVKDLIRTSLKEERPQQTVPFNTNTKSPKLNERNESNEP